MNNPLFDIDIKCDGDKVVFDFTKVGNEIFRDFHRKLERLCEADFDQFARNLGYVKLEPGQLVVREDLCDYCFANNYNKAINYIRLAPDEVAVNVHYLLSLANATCKDTCQACDGDAECGRCWVEELRKKATAALEREVKE